MSKRPREIGRKRLLLLSKINNLFNKIIHDEYPETSEFNKECLVRDDQALTNAIKELKVAVKKFEDETKLKLDIMLYEKGNKDANNTKNDFKTISGLYVG